MTAGQGAGWPELWTGSRMGLAGRGPGWRCAAVAQGPGGRQDLDAVRGGEFGQAARVGRDGIGQPEIGGGLAGGGDELVEPAG